MKTFGEMKKTLLKFGIPETVVNNLPDMEYSALTGKPTLDVFKFDDYLHKVCGDYEKQGKSMKDLFNELFGNKSKEIASYFGLED